MAKQIAKVDMTLIDKKGLLASFWVTLTNGVAFRAMLLQSKRNDGHNFVSLPSKAYTDANGQTQYQRLLTVPQELYDELNETLTASYNNAKLNAVNAQVPSPNNTGQTTPEPAPQQSAPAAIPSMEDIINGV